MVADRGLVSHLCALVAAVISVSTPCFAAATADHLLQQIEARGPRSVLYELVSDRARFERVCDSIETANPKWLAVARRLKSASDAASSLALNYSVARALPRAPERVLALIGTEFSVQDVCTSPYVEPNAGVAETYQRRTIAALRKVHAPQLAEVKVQCLAQIEASLAHN